MRFARQRRDIVSREVAPTRATSAAPSRPAPANHLAQNELRQGGEPLPAAVRGFFEPRFGRDFGDVRVHRGRAAAESADSIGALAYTAGRDVVFAAGQYAPATSAGLRLVAHELAHVAQQGDGAPRQVGRRMRMEDPDRALAGSPATTVAAEMNTYASTLCSSFGVARSGTDAFVQPSSAAACATTPSQTACRCMCDLHNATNTWTLRIDDDDAAHTVEGARTVTINSRRSEFALGAWSQGGQRVFMDSPRLLAHELCGHAWLMERGVHPAARCVNSGRPDHTATIALENQISREVGGPLVDRRGSFTDPHQGESFARITLSSFPTGSFSTASLPPDMRARLAKAAAFLQRPSLQHDTCTFDVLADVIGHADHTGGAAINQTVSLERAQNVRDKLVTTHGIPPTRFQSVIGKGDTECPPCPASTPGCRNPDCRKADIFMFFFPAASEGSP